MAYQPILLYLTIPLSLQPNYLLYSTRLLFLN